MLFGRRCRMAQAKVLTGGCGYVPTTALRLLGYLVVTMVMLETCCQKNSKLLKKMKNVEKWCKTD